MLDTMDTKRKVHPVQHKIKREIYVNAENEVEFSGEGSIPENVSPKSALNKTQEKRTTSIVAMIVKKQTLSIAILAELMIVLIACVQTLKMKQK